MPVKARDSHSAKRHGYDANCAGFSKDVKQPHSSETHRRREHLHRCRFARHLRTLLPTLGQSSGSRGHRLLDSLSGRARRACPPSKKLRWEAEADPGYRRDGCLNQGQACHPVPSVPRLPRRTTVDVSLCHAYHAKCRPRPSAPPSAICTTPATQNDGRCQFVPRLPRKTTVDVSLCHACHAKCRGVTGA